MQSSLAALTQQAVDALYDAIPANVTVADAMALPFGAERNLTLRKAMGIPITTGEVCMVTQAGIVQVVTLTRGTATRYASKLEAALPSGWTIDVTRRPDRRWLVTAHS